MKRLVLVAALLVACSSDPGEVEVSPTITLVQPSADEPLNGEVTVVLEASSQGIDIESFEVLEPEPLRDVEPVMNPGAQTAMLPLEIRTSSYPDGPLEIVVRARNAKGKETERTFTFEVSSTARTVSLDPSFASYRSEAGMTVSTTDGLANPGGLGYASPDKVALEAGGTVFKVVTRMGWPAASPPTAASLETSNEYNIPGLRLWVPHQEGDPAKNVARARVEVDQGHVEPVTIDLLPASASPPGTKAYLLPLSSNGIPFLTQLTTRTPLRITATVTDDVGHAWTANGGFWIVYLEPLPPPLVATVDPDYASAAEAASVYAYRLANGTYEPAFSSAHGERITHFIVTNPNAEPVALDAAIGGANAWSLTESWVGFVASTSTSYVRRSRNPVNCLSPLPPDEGSHPCAITLAQVSGLGCVDPAPYVNGPAPVEYTWDGSLSVSAYEDGAPASRTSSDRLIVPAAAGTAAGRLDLYVARPHVPRGSAPVLVWDAGRQSYTRNAYSVNRMTGMSSQQMICGYGGNATYTQDTYPWTFTDWREKVSSAVESIDGALVLGASAMVAGGEEYGPVREFSTTALPSSISH